MSAPICDFVKKYAESNPCRLHMPGHKGKSFLGFEKLDITEIDGADNLFAPNGIIRESEKNAEKAFGSRTFYSAGGSTLCIQAMLHLLALHAFEEGKEPHVLAARNAHKAFLNAAALLGIKIKWIFPKDASTYHSCLVTAETVESELERDKSITAVYLTSPDYLGNIADIESIAKVCKKRGVTLAVDNAHGAYLKFLPSSCHPIDLGADICCDSAHKTLPVLTGGAYLHIAKNAPEVFAERAVSSLSLFGSSSPSYLILQSLDAMNDRFSLFRAELEKFLPKVQKVKEELKNHGFSLLDGEKLKITLVPKSFGYTGEEIAKILEEKNIFPEFYDPDFIVFMISPLGCGDDLERLLKALVSIERRKAINDEIPVLSKPEAVLTPREAIFKKSEILPVESCLGRICASAAISCPPAIPLVVCGEKIDKNIIENFKYYGVKTCAVISE